nr:hypothetical protein [Geobacillus sp. FJAT-46040]
MALKKDQILNLMAMVVHPLIAVMDVFAFLEPIMQLLNNDAFVQPDRQSELRQNDQRLIIEKQVGHVILSPSDEMFPHRSTFLINFIVNERKPPNSAITAILA